ncbi:TPA: hypothetical protein ACGOYW_000504 [Streptococcus suis]
MNDLEYLEHLFKRYYFEVLGLEVFVDDVNKAKVKRLGIEIRQTMLNFERKNNI